MSCGLSDFFLLASGLDFEAHFTAMPPSLGERIRTRILPAALLVVAVLLILDAGRLALADFYDQSSDPADWERAAAIEPGNAVHWHRLGRYRLWDFQNADLRRAIGYYERATRLNPRSPFSWLDLASAYEMAGDSVRARQAFEQAKSAYPISAEVAWNYGNFLLRSGNLPEALAEIHRAVLTDPSFEPLAVSVCWRAGVSFDQIFDQVVPPRARAYLSAADFFLGEGDINSALKTWARAQALNEPIELARSFPFLEQLIRLARPSEARLVWQQALAKTNRKAPAVAPGSLIWDGGFEESFPNGGLGWQRLNATGASIGLDSSVHRSGTSALRVSFDGSANIDFEHVRQVVVVEPRTRYRFEAYVRCEGVSTDSGPQFRIFDRHHPAALNVQTQSLTGTLANWTPQELEFVTGPDTHFLFVILQRRPSRKLDNKLSGTLWADDVSLVPLHVASQAKP